MGRVDEMRKPKTIQQEKGMSLLESQDGVVLFVPLREWM